MMMSTILAALHILGTCLVGGALGVYWLSLWLTLSLKCNLVQLAFVGCQSCPCALDGSCTSDNLNNDAQCAGCQALSTSLCQPAVQTQNQYILAVTGPATLVAMAFAALYSLLAIRRWELRRGALEAKKQAAGLAVDQQTRLVLAGDKPTITPGTLSDMVSFLLETGEKRCIAVADRCRRALLDRGFELQVRKGLPPMKVNQKKVPSKATTSLGTSGGSGIGLSSSSTSKSGTANVTSGEVSINVDGTEYNSESMMHTLEDYATLQKDNYSQQQQKQQPSPPHSFTSSPTVLRSFNGHSSGLGSSKR